MLNESTIEQSLIDQLISQGYTYHAGPDIAPYSDNPQRASFASVLLESHFKASLQQLNPSLPESARQEAYQRIVNLGTEDIMENNERFHNLLTSGVTVEYTKDGKTKGIKVRLLDVAQPENNSFWVVNQLVVKENNNERRFDVVLFINGLPLVFIELKNATDEKATLRKAYTQIQNYKKAVPSIFYYNAICVISDGIDAGTSSVSAPFSRYLSWKSPAVVKEGLTIGGKPSNSLKGGLTNTGDTKPYNLELIKPSVLNSANKSIYPLLKDRAKAMRLKPTRAEAVLWEELKSKKLGVKFRQQHIIENYIVDFCCLKMGLIIEVDGGIHDTQEIQDEARTELIESLGFKVIRFTNDEVLHKIETVTSKINHFISTKNSPLSDGERTVNPESEPLKSKTNHHISTTKSPSGDLGASVIGASEAPIAYSTRTLTDLQILTKHMLNKKTLVELIRYCTVFEQEEKKDEKTGLVFQIKIKKVAAYHQYYAVQKAVAETIRATAKIPPSNEIQSASKNVPPSGGQGATTNGDRKIGVIWHTQGSGKSLSMVFYCGQIITHPQMENPTIVMLTDRNDLDDQLFGTFGNCVELLRQTPVQANNREHLKELLKVSGGGVVFTTIQKFAPEEGNVYDTLSERTNIVVVADEAHRSQYGFAAREVETDEGMETRYGNAKYLRDAIPNASYIGFTGTPIEKEDKSTPAVFGKYIDVYDIKQAVDDGATVPISYEARLVKVKLDEKIGKTIDQEINAISNTTEAQIEKAKKRTATIDAVVGHDDRVRDIAKDMVEHFEARQKVFEGKAMIVGMTRTICAKLYNAIIEIRPEWHHEDKDKGMIKVIMTSTSDDEAILQPHHTTKKQRKDLATRMKDPNDELKIVIVRDMWLTGFDAPSMHTLYVDKKMQGANLMQAIARVNRVYGNKPGGLIVDYIGIGQDLRNAMVTYLNSGGEGAPVVDIREAIAGMKEKFEIIEQMFHGYDINAYFTSATAQKLQILLGAQNFILSSESLKDRFIKEVTILSKLFAMSTPSLEANEIKDGVAFFQAIKSRINKFTGEGVKSDYEVETAIKQIVDDALSSDGVIDIFEAAGIQAPSIGILSDEFLLEVKNMKHKNLAFQLLKKLLSDEIRIRKKTNIAQSKRFSEMLASVVKRYHNNQIDSAEIIEILSDMGREMTQEDNKAKDLGLSPVEFAFYSVLAENESTKMLEDVTMKELIHTIVEVIRKNATVDWSKRDDVRAKLRLTVRKILMRYGYPPDLARLEADRVIAQGESLAEMFSRDEE